MAPIYDSDVAERRWEEEKWRHYELWEKLEAKRKKRRRLWIILTVILFVLLSGVPTVMDRHLKWKTLSTSRELAQLLNRTKTQAALKNQAVRLRLRNTEKSGLVYKLFTGDKCHNDDQKLAEKGKLLSLNEQKTIRWIKPAKGERFDLPALSSSFCFHPLQENSSVKAFAFIPAKDLSDKRMDRISVVYLRGENAEISFN